MGDSYAYQLLIILKNSLTDQHLEGNSKEIRQMFHVESHTIYLQSMSAC